jgi:hypothetical protein
MEKKEKKKPPPPSNDKAKDKGADSIIASIDDLYLWKCVYADKKGGKGGGKVVEASPVDLADGPPPPLEIQVSIELHQWRTVRDCGQKIEGEDDGTEQEQPPSASAPASPSKPK